MFLWIKGLDSTILIAVIVPVIMHKLYLVRFALTVFIELS